jgi:hypothetical protein
MRCRPRSGESGGEEADADRGLAVRIVPYCSLKVPDSSIARGSGSFLISSGSLREALPLMAKRPFLSEKTALTPFDNCFELNAFSTVMRVQFPSFTTFALSPTTSFSPFTDNS